MTLTQPSLVVQVPDDVVASLDESLRAAVRREGIDPQADVAAVRRLADALVREHDERSLTGVVAPVADPGAVIAELLARVSGFGPLQPLLDDPEVEEIWINQPSCSTERIPHRSNCLEDVQKLVGAQAYDRAVTPTSHTVIHHVTRNRDDLLPSCDQLPGPEHVYSSDGRRSSTAEFWHACHTDAGRLVAHAAVGHGCCSVCLEVARELRAGPPV